HATREGVEALTQVLLLHGVDQVSIDDPADLDDIMNKEHEYDWDYVDEKLKAYPNREPSVSAYFEDNEENRQLIQNIKIDVMKLKAEEQYGNFGDKADFGRLYAETIVVDDEGWKDKWKENFKPTKITERIVVKPTWEDYDPEEGELVLQIDPGMAFGTGTHETTSLCMKMLEKYINPSRAKILDVGCGSGILAISAALLGCDDVLGIEIDPDAVRVAVENVELNKVDDSVKVCEGDLTKGIDYKADILVANLMHNLVIELAPSARKHLNKDGLFISSGILLEKRDKVAEAVKAAGFDIVEIPEDGEWCAIVAKPRKKFLGLF
ncbi:MAG: 50S ribosomal protein L11 methyltransferase, partial [Bacillota bacterium]|nr:50S ribosomal protein L11 methyltransferase [Bacillota bacterium]